MPCNNLTALEELFALTSSYGGTAVPRNGLMYLHDSSRGGIPEPSSITLPSGANQPGITRQNFLRIIEEALTIADEALLEVEQADQQDRRDALTLGRGFRHPPKQ